ncbi:type II secretion system protein [Oxynema sp. CENA135]|uniref:hormogonium polysaccharide biosynthesis protein HpsA n=1 Tax=Oxynema sp. CENA135 TaxID=984206 RepID=UPI00190E0A4B|nr:hormogonium polysaccharide biosynthesis protein HpsA [Oxynema sp. CENA135]MBK4732778.1 type II secretion system protein [Oxynema sp. CENA135]
MPQQRKIQKALNRLVQSMTRCVQQATSREAYQLMRAALLSKRQSQSGFVLPTTTLLIVVMLLVAGALIFRSYQRSTDVIGDYQQQSVQNAATPAIERAKAKLELLFSDLGPQELAENNIEGKLADPDIYDFTDETRITIPDVVGDAIPNLAWTYQTDTDGNDTPDTTTVYSIVLRSTIGEEGSQKTIDPELPNADLITKDKDKANYLLVRNGPIIEQRDSSDNQICRVTVDPDSTGVLGWFPIGTALFRKNFQVYALTVPNSVLQGTGGNFSLSTLQYQQDRTFEGLNKWGAWFRTDLEVTPGPAFNWNGAIHTEGNLFAAPENSFRSYLISDEESCFYKPELNSELSAWGHLVYGSIANTSASTVKIDTYDEHNNPPQLNGNTDSFNDGADLIDITLDPTEVLTRNASIPRGADLDNIEDINGLEDDPWDGSQGWANGPISTRVNRGQSQAPPYVDDTYRADNIYGPKPGYQPPEIDQATGLYQVNPVCPVGEDIVDGGNCDVSSLDDLTKNEPSNPSIDPNDYGLDGYWERRATGQGLRIIVGQRLELGNPFGWVRDADRNGTYLNNPNDKNYGEDPLNPQDLGFTTPTQKGSHEFRQQKTLRDNLAAVQATAVYHHSQANGLTPVACVATTVHPGTVETLKNSATFRELAINGDNTLITDFFYGHGTNGWEFNVPDPENAELRKALANLANFAGDPDGAFPPKQEAGIVHPNPLLTMWGNFSNLLRANGSLADNTTRQTAACTLGMLAYNLNYLQQYDYTNSGSQSQLTALDADLQALSDGGDGNGEIRLDGSEIKIFDSNGSEIAQMPTNQILPPDAYIAALPEERQSLARLLHLKEQVKRDRKYGFEQSPIAGSNAKYTYNVQFADFDYAGKSYAVNDPIEIGCDFSDSTGNDYFGFGEPQDADDEQKFIRLTKLICSPDPKFPALYYIFPADNHPHDGTGGVEQPEDEPYIDELNVTYSYQALSENDIEAIANLSKPKAKADWALPQTTPDSSTFNATAAPNNSRQELVKYVDSGGDEQDIRVAIKDSALFNPREQMNVRVLNLDLDLLRSNSAAGAESWLSESGIVYAFREDALREDGIARPSGPQMNAFTPSDPNLINGISPKPVDYYADPDRRPHAFRLKNGADISREETIRGMTFVSDQPVYSQGNFNLHGNDNAIEEFTTALNDDFGNFYNRNNLNPNFANPDNDTWRPVEVLADAITILSGNFCDGSLEDGFVNENVGNPNINTANEYGCPNGIRYTSYINQNRPKNNNDVNWARENPFDGGSPVLISHNAEPMVATGNAGVPPTSYNGSYYRFNALPWNDGRKQIPAPDKTWVNMVMVNGVVPLRQGQSNGGLHNFPRLIEAWNGKNLYIRGSFIQLNFSTYATGPYEHDAWEPGTPAKTGKTSNYTSNNGEQENIFYYWAPNRLWGYDVGLQYMPPGPASSRMSELSNERNEFYREPKADDPYICKLRAALSDDLACSE